MQPDVANGSLNNEPGAECGAIDTSDQSPLLCLSVRSHLRLFLADCVEKVRTNTLSGTMIESHSSKPRLEKRNSRKTL
jgi:hypothetical protein